jgi:hypothetical protein
MRMAILASIVLAASPAQQNKVLDVLDVRDPVSLIKPKRFNPVLTYNAALKLDVESSPPWIKASFEKPDENSAQGFSAVFFETDYAAVLPPFDGRRIPDGTGEWINVWLGYDKFAFDYKNDEGEPLNATVLIQDWVSWLSAKHDGLKSVRTSGDKQTELPLLYEEEVILNPGAGTIEINLKKTMRCNDGAKGLGLDNIKAFGLCIKPGRHRGTRVVGLNRFRLEGRDAAAGVFSYPEKVKCEKCGRGFTDEYAPYCPFCGAAVASYKEIPKEVPPAEGRILLRPTDGTRAALASGGGDDLSDQVLGSKGSALVAHYDVYYNRPMGSSPAPQRKRVVWEWSFTFKFALGAEFDAKPAVKNAVLWLSPGVKGKDDPASVFCKKPWFPGLLVYSHPKEFQGWTGSQVSWRTLPPFEKLIYVSGQHPGPATQSPKLKATDLEAPEVFPIDLTPYVREAVARGDRILSFTLKAFTPFGAHKEPHGMGHCFTFEGLEKPRGPFIAVELEK